jgi:NADH-quinone oxidoreductase subunit A
MVPTPHDPVATLVFFLLVFAVVGVVFLFFHLLMGSFIRPNKPDAEKLTIYECGEPTVGSAWVQFDLRYYVVALLFVIFDVEVAFFFPWATVFGTANHLANLPLAKTEAELAEMSDSAKERQKQRQAEIEKQRQKLSDQLLPSGISKESRRTMNLTIREKVINEKGESEEKDRAVPITPGEASTWAKIAFWDILIFFGVLMVGFAYVWRRGDIDWVRAYAHHDEPPAEIEKPLEQSAAQASSSPVAVH